MKNRGQLFDLHADLDVRTRKLKVKKPASTRTSSKKEAVSKASSADFYEDEQPIQLSGPSTYNYGMSHSSMAETWSAESFEANNVEEADYSVISSYANDTYENDEQGLQMSEVDNVQYAEESPATYQAMSEDNTQSSFLDEISSLAAPPAPPQPRMHHPDPLKALGDAVKGMSDDDFANDLAAILEGNKVFDPEKKELVSKDKVDDDFVTKLKEADNQRAASGNDKTGANNAADKDKTDPNAIFEKIAQNMSFANSFDLGEFEMEQRFESFDMNLPVPPPPPIPPAPPPLPPLPNLPTPPNPFDALPFSTEDFVKDLDQIGTNSEAFEKTAKDANWPAAPAGLTQPNAERTKQMFGTFEYEADSTAGHCGIKIKGSWEGDNITTVDIPQLTGKKAGNADIKKGAIRFNKKAAKQLQKLWQAWETAGLLDRVLTYDGGFVPRFIKRKDGTCATTLSNHAWGSAFDINAQWNGLGAEPAVMGSKGCVRELVEIANQHGFYWGGHFGTKDGMHFEVAKIIEYKD